jgi:sigma-B regulation protein RsbU (phosphoserine phosphatase)
MQLTAGDVLRAFHHDFINLFLAAAFISIGLLAIGFSFIRRRFDALLSFFAWFAIMYGDRLWLQSHLAHIVMPPSPFFEKLRMAINFFVPIPAFLFVYASGLIGRKGSAVTYLFCVLQLGLVVAIFLGAPLHLLDKLNSIFVIVTLITLIILSFRLPSRRKDFLVIRIGLLIFIAFAIGTNAAEILGFHPNIESYGFAIFLGCLGYVAAQRALERDQQLNSIQQELDIAKRIQTSILPSAFPSSPHFRVATRYVPMTSVAGDFYDFLVSNDGKAGLLIADVSGHGVPAALIASMVKIAATSQRVHAAHPAKLLAGMNDTLCGNTQNQFVTAAYLYLDAHTGTLRYSAAAHPPLLLLRDGGITALEENGLMLALFPLATYTTAEQTLRPGDRFVLYTDGIIEAVNAREEEFGHERLCALLQSSAGRSHTETADLIITSVQDWAAAQDDDLTVLVCDYIAGA